MAVPKRRKSKGKTRRGRNSHYVRKEVTAVKTEDGKAFKRPHIEERIEL